MGTEQQLHSRLTEGIRQVRIERPSRKNALTLPMFAELAAILDEANRDTDVRAVVLSGGGDSFTAGHDLDAFAQWPQQRGDPVPAFLHALADLDKPLIVAVHGVAMGIGATLLLHADWVCCLADARLRFPFVDLGIGPEAGSSFLLARAVGLQRARRLLLGGEEFSGRQAFEWGLVTELVDHDVLMENTLLRAHALADKPAPAFAGIKQLIKRPPTGIGERIDEELAFINHALAERHGTE